MGIIKRQGLKSTLVNVISAFVGAASILFIYPLKDDYYGFALWFYNAAFLLLPIASFGVTSIIIKYFPIYSKSENPNNSGFLSLIFSLISGGYVLFLFVWYLFKSYILRLFDILEMDATAILENELYLLIFLYLLIGLLALVNYSSNHLRIVVPNIIQQLGYKIYLPLLVLASVYYGFSESEFALYILLFFGIANVLMILYLKYLGALKFGRIKKPRKDFSYKSMATFGLFGSLNSLSGSLAFRIDAVMIPFLKDMLQNGYYGKVLFMANVLEMPLRAISQISAPIISKAWEENDISEIETVYKKASANLFLAGCIFFLVIWYILDELILISSNPDSFPSARMIFFYLALAKLFDMLTSVNNQIIAYSKAYKYNLIFLILLGVSNLTLNYFLIKEKGIVGAAMATAISLLLFNFLKLVFIYWKFKLHPFTIRTLKTVIVFVALIFLYDKINIIANPWLLIIIKSFFICFSFGLIAFYWKISEDINEMIIKLFKKKTL